LTENSSFTVGRPRRTSISPLLGAGSRCGRSAVPCPPTDRRC